MVEFDSCIVHYGEIGTKSGNRQYFEILLVDNIKAKTKGLVRKYIREYGQIVLEIESKNMDSLRDILTKIPGIIYFSFAVRCEVNETDIKRCVLEYLKDMQYETFKIDTKRHYKDAPFTSVELNPVIGEAVIDTYGKKVKMKGADVYVKIEICRNHAFVSTEEILGVGGMPVDEKQKVVCLLSGGFDSPVAGYLMMKRGCTVVFVHFQNQNQMKESVEGKIVDLAKQLSKFQTHTKLYIIPFEEIQKEIIIKTSSELRMLVYRRFMIKIAAEIAMLENAEFLVLGDSMSQVASQTIHNLSATYSGSSVHILSPLVGFDKTEIMAIARKIGTYDISVQPYGDCCSYFVPKHPALKTSAGLLKKQETNFEVDGLVKNAMGLGRVLEF